MKFKNHILILFCFSFLLPSDNELTILNFNIHGFSGNKISKKVNKIINQINNYDILSIQENWVHNNKFIKKLLNHNLFFSNKKRKTIYKSGLTLGVKSNLNILKHDEVIFNDCHGIFFNGSDCLASKGFMMSRIEGDGYFLDLYNTHLDAGSTHKDIQVRQKQVEVLQKYILENSLGNAIVLSGDFNIDYKTNADIIDSFAETFSFKFITNQSSPEIDYIFYRGNDQFILDVQNINYNDSLNFLSDHKPLSIKVLINK